MSEDSHPVLVTGATGTVGSLVVSGLLERQATVRAFVHSEDPRAEALRDQGVEVVVGDLLDDQLLDRAVGDAVKVFSLTPPVQDQIMQANAITAAALRSGSNPHVVRLSVAKSSVSAPMVISAQHGEIDQVLRDSGLPVTFLKPNFFMQNTLLGADSVGSQGVLFQAMGDGKLGMIDARDIADVAVEVLTGMGHEGKSYTLTGPESISFTQLAQQLSESVGKDVTAVDVPVVAARQSMIEMGFPEWVAAAFSDYFGYYRNNYGDFFTDDVRNLTGRTARTYRDFSRDFGGAFA